MCRYVGESLEFAAHYHDINGESANSLSVTACVYGPAHTLISSGAATFMARGIYHYPWTAVSAGIHYCIFETSDTSVTIKDLATSIPVRARSVFGGGGSCG